MIVGLNQREHRALRAATPAPTLDTNAAPRRLRTPCGETTIEFLHLVTILGLKSSFSLFSILPLSDSHVDYRPSSDQLMVASWQPRLLEYGNNLSNCSSAPQSYNATGARRQRREPINKSPCGQIKNGLVLLLSQKTNKGSAEYEKDKLRYQGLTHKLIR